MGIQLLGGQESLLSKFFWNLLGVELLSRSSTSIRNLPPRVSRPRCNLLQNQYVLIMLLPRILFLMKKSVKKILIEASPRQPNNTVLNAILMCVTQSHQAFLTMGSASAFSPKLPVWLRFGVFLIFACIPIVYLVCLDIRGDDNTKRCSH